MKNLFTAAVKKTVSVLALLFLVVGSATGSDIAFIYKTEINGANSFANLLSSKNFSTDLIEISEAASVSFNDYRLIIVDSNTGFGYTWDGSDTLVNNIQNSGKPVLALGFGGACLFEEMNVSLNWGNSWINSDTNSTYEQNTKIYCVDTSSFVFTTPNKISIPNDQIIQLYTKTGHIGVYAPNLSDQVILTGRESNNDTHYSITSEGIYWLWGFTNSPSSMTEDGKNIFLNIVTFMTNTKNIAFIYKTFSKRGNDFAALLSSRGYPTDLIEINNVSSTDFNDYDLIMVDSKTSEGYDWGSESAVTNINNSGKPVFGLGFGGAGLFENMDVSLNWGNGWINKDSSSTNSNDTQIYCTDTSLSIFRKPYKIDIPGDQIIRLYDNSGHIGEYAPYLSDEVILIGREPANDTHYSLASENKHWLWGFINPPENMTETGKDLFLNIVYNIVNGEALDIKDNYSTLPVSFKIEQNYPNPFNAGTRIKYRLPKSQLVRLSIYNSAGQLITTLVNQYQTAGYHSVNWDANNISSGVYFYRIKTEKQSAIKKCVLIK